MLLDRSCYLKNNEQPLLWLLNKKLTMGDLGTILVASCCVIA